MTRRRGFTLVEGLIGLVVAILVTGMAYQLHRSAFVSLNATLGPQMGLQMATRKALLEFVRELQECIEFVRPVQGATLSYLLARDKLDRPMLAYATVDQKATAAAGRTLYNVYVNRSDDALGEKDRQRWLFGSVARLTFTSLGSGAVQIHMDVWEQGRTYPVLTTVRARNIAPEAEL